MVELRSSRCASGMASTPSSTTVAAEHPPGSPLHPGGQPGEDALLGLHVGRAGQDGAQARDAVEDAGPDQPAAGEGEQRGHEREGREDGDDDDRDTGGAEGPQDRRLEDEEAGDRDGHGQRRERHGAPGRRHRALDRGEHGPVAASAPAGASVVLVDEPVQLLAEPGHHEQAVVDRQAEPEHGHDVDDGRVEVDPVGEGEKRREAAGDRRDGAGHRHRRGEEAAEDEHHDDQRDRQRDRLARAQVGLHLRGDGVDDQGRAADDARDPRCHLLQVLGHLVETRVHLGDRVGLLGAGQRRVELDDDEEPVAVVRDERRGGGVGGAARAARAGR